jgi:predicted nucleic acid-binding protein
MLLDASLLIDHTEGRPGAVSLAQVLDPEGATLRLPAPVLFELWIGAAHATSRKGELQRLEELETSYELAGFEAADARAAGKLQAALHRVGRGLGFVDAQVAGMAIARSEDLITGDRRLAGVGHGVPVRTCRRL